MKLKEIEKWAFCKGIVSGEYWVAADKDLKLYVYDSEPHTFHNIWTDGYTCMPTPSSYTGKKHWTKAIRKFTV